MPRRVAIVWRRLCAYRVMTLAVVSLCGGIALRPAQATILLFDQERDTSGLVKPASSGGRLPADYGDHVTSSVMAVPGGSFTYGNGGEGYTPNITVDIFTDLATATDSRARLWQNGYGDLVNVVFADGPGTSGSPGLNVRFTAAPGYMVDLYGFDLAGFGADYTIAAVQVLSDASTLFSATDVLVEGNGTGPPRTTFAFQTPLSATDLLLRLDFSNIAPAIQDNIGIDSIRFGQTPPGVVPEPATAVLLLLGGIALGLRPAVRWPRTRRTGACEGHYRGGGQPAAPAVSGPRSPAFTASSGVQRRGQCADPSLCHPPRDVCSGDVAKGLSAR